MPIITKERWNEAQKAEREFHNDESLESAIDHYQNSYNQYFDYLNIDKIKPINSESKLILEVGCADIPSLTFCGGYEGIIIEPMPSPFLEKLISNFPILLIKDTVENAEIPFVDEAWIFNVMQHIIDPELFISKIKHSANTIRFFEPINTDYNVCHPQSYTLEFFKDHFGDCVKHYPHNDKAVNFHEWECAYGVWNKS